MRPFYCGTEYEEWSDGNCYQCKRFTYNYELGRYEGPNCELCDALLLAYFDDGEVTDDVAKRIGRDTKSNRCTEFQPREGKEEA